MAIKHSIFRAILAAATAGVLVACESVSLTGGDRAAKPAANSSANAGGGAMASQTIKTTGDTLIDRWAQDAAETMAAREAIANRGLRAKNVILFIGDGMDPTTITAARILEGQLDGGEGEENFLSFETLPHLALAKTYTTSAQTPDSAGTATAMMHGAKTKSGVVGLTDKVEYADCASAEGAVLPSLAKSAAGSGRATGVISTARLTHATPAAVYAHAADRNWEDDTQLTDEARTNGCIDIARQFMEFDGLDIALGGGRRHFLPLGTTDPEYPDQSGRRGDNRDLTAEWAGRSDAHVYVWNREQFEALDTNQKVLGLFEPSHMEYEFDRAKTNGEPDLEAMTRFAIEALSRNDDGFFLMVEAGRIDHAHHGGNARRALTDTIALADAVNAAKAMTDPADTLIIVTADHGHTFNFQGYPVKGNDILGLVRSPYERYNDAEGYAVAADGKRYTTLGYGNGPGAVVAHPGEAGEPDLYTDGRPDYTDDDVADPDFRQPAAIPLGSETHGGQDVTIYADGPGAHLFGGTVEQTYIYYVMRAAMGL